MNTQFNVPPASVAGTAPAPVAEPVAEKPAEDTRIKFKDQTQLNNFWNCILNKKPYKKEFDIKGLKVIFRNKTSKEVQELVLYMDSHNTSLVTTYDYLYSKALLALSLVQVGDDYIDNGTFEEKRTFLDTLADITLRVLIKAASVFEKEIEQMEAEIYSPNF